MSVRRSVPFCQRRIPKRLNFLRFQTSPRHFGERSKSSAFFTSSPRRPRCERLERLVSYRSPIGLQVHFFVLADLRLGDLPSQTARGPTAAFRPRSRRMNAFARKKIEGSGSGSWSKKHYSSEQHCLKPSASEPAAARAFRQTNLFEPTPGAPRPAAPRASYCSPAISGPVPTGPRPARGLFLPWSASCI